MAARRVCRPEGKGQTTHSGLCVHRRHVPLTASTCRRFRVVMTVLILSRCDLRDVRKQEAYNQKPSRHNLKEYNLKHFSLILKQPDHLPTHLNKERVHFCERLFHDRTSHSSNFQLRVLGNQLLGYRRSYIKQLLGYCRSYIKGVGLLPPLTLNGSAMQLWSLRGAGCSVVAGCRPPLAPHPLTAHRDQGGLRAPTKSCPRLFALDKDRDLVQNLQPH